MFDDGSTPSDKTALMQAIKSRDVARAKSLILSGADVNYMDKKNWNALHYASWEGLLEIVESILQKHIKGNHFNIDARTKDGQTALSLATYEGHEDIVRLLLECGADINLYADTNLTRNFRSSWTLLHHASYRGWIRIVQAILDKSDLDAKTEEGMTALALAANMGHQHIAEKLLLSGAGVGGVDKDKWTLLHHAAFKGWLSVVEMILERQPNLEDKTCYGETALILSAFKGHREVVELLLKSGASMDWCLLHWASIQGWIEIVKHMVLNGKCDINRRFYGDTALMLAVNSRHEEIAELLLKHGADVHDEPDGCDTVLTKAIWSGSSAKLISLLVEKGAYFESIDYGKICSNSVLKERLLKDRDTCTQALVNEYNVACLPALKELSGSYNIVLPSIEKLNIDGGNALREIEKAVDHEIETKGICNVMKVRPLVLQMMAVRSLLDYHCCQ